MNMPREKGAIEDVIWTFAQVMIIFVVAFLWFLDGVRRVWAEVAAVGCEEDDREILNFATTNAVVHTAIILIGLWLGQYLRKGQRATVTRSILICFAVCFMFLIMAQQTETFFSIASIYFKGTAGFILPLLGAASMILWLVAAILISQLDRQTKGIYPLVVSSYVKAWIVVALLAVVFFRFVVVPVWDLASQYNLIPYTEVATFAYNGNFEVVFTRVASSTHTVVFVAGMVWGICAGFFMKNKRDIMLAGTMGSAFISLCLVRIGVTSKLLIFLEFTALFFGEHLSISEMMIISMNYTAWFSAGVYFELSWAGSYTNTHSNPSPSPASESFSRRQNLDLVIAVVIILGLCLTALPFVYSLMISVMVLIVVGVRAEPDIIPPYREGHSARGSHEASLARWDAVTANFPKTGLKYTVVGDSALADELVALLEDREGKEAVVRGDFKNGNVDFAFYIPKTQGATYEDVVGTALEIRKQKNIKKIVMALHVPQRTEGRYSQWVFQEAEKVILEAGIPSVSIRLKGALFGCFKETELGWILEKNMALFPSSWVVTDYIYIKNAVLALLQAEMKLGKSPEAVSGKSFFVTNEEPVTERTMARIIANFKPDISVWVVPTWIEKLWVVFCIKMRKEHWVIQNTNDGELFRSRELLGYAPCFTLEEGVQFMIDEWMLKKAKEEVDDAIVLLETKKRRLAALEAVLCVAKQGKTPRAPQQKAVQDKRPMMKPALRPQTVPTPPQQPHGLVNPITGGALSKDPSQVAKRIFSSVMSELAALLQTITPSLPLVQRDAKGYDIVFPIPLKLSSHLTDFLRKRLNPKLKEDPLFKGSCIKVNLQPPVAPSVGETRSSQHSVYDVEI